MLLKEWGERVGLIEIASNNSVWRGMDYYENKKVLSWHKAEDGTYNGVVSGQEGKDYSLIKSILERQHVTVHLLTAGG